MSIDTPRAVATIEEVAAAAGVSRSTVSRVVNGSTAVSPAALEAVQRAISELNYVPNRAARSLASRATMAIALVVPEDTTRFFGDPFFAAVVSGIRLGLLDGLVDVHTRGGRLSIAWAGGASDPVFLTGPATTVFEGQIELPDLL